MEYEIHERTLHFREPAGTSRGTYRTRRVWYVVLKADGRQGWGECAPLPRLSCDDLPDYAERLHEACQGVCRTGVLSADLLPYPSIRFGLECALLMLHRGNRRLFDTPFANGLEGMPINGLIWMGSYDEMTRRMEQKVAAGFHCIKIKIGAIRWAEEWQLLQRCRAIAPDVQLRVDANGAFTPEEAPERLAQLAQLGIHSIEQPIRQGQWPEMARLCQSSPVPIALDEELIGIHTTDQKVRLLEAIRPHYIILKLSLHGGLAGCDEWIRLAQERGIGWWATSALESNIGLSAIAQWASQYRPTLPQGLGTGLLYTDNTPPETEVRGEKIFYKLKIES